MLEHCSVEKRLGEKFVFDISFSVAIGLNEMPVRIEVVGDTQSEAEERAIALLKDSARYDILKVSRRTIGKGGEK